MRPNSTEIAVVALDGKELRYTYIEIPESGTLESVASYPVQISSERVPPEALGEVSAYARQLFPNTYTSRRVIVPASARLNFGTALDQTFTRTTKDTVRFEILLDRGKEQELIFSDVLEPKSLRRRHTGSWKDHSISLASYEGQHVRFVFRTTIGSDDENSNRGRIRTAPLWGNPTLFAGKPKRTVDTPNMIVISLDTLRADHLGVYGYDRNTSPNIDRFAENAFVFEYCISPTSWTGPAHASLFTGLNPAVHGVGGYQNHRLGETAVTFAELAQRAGYLTVGYTDGGAVAGTAGMAQGYDLYWDNRKGAAQFQGISENQYYLAVKWLGLHRDHPFVMFFHTYEIHNPYDPPSPFLERFKTGTKNYAEGRSKSRKHVLENVGLYDGGIAYTDSVMGFFFDWLDENGLLENTAILLLSDHGDEFWDHGGSQHLSTLYDELVRVPFILRLPGASPRGGRIERMIGLSDGFATLLDLLDISYDAPLDSSSVLPLLEGGAATSSFDRVSVEGFVFSERLNRMTVAHRTADFKYIARADLDVEGSPIAALVASGTPSGNLDLGQAILDALSGPERAPGVLEEYYDLNADPKELTDLSSEKEGLAKESREALMVLLEKYEERRKQYDFDREPQLSLSPEERDALKALGYLN